MASSRKSRRSQSTRLEAPLLLEDRVVPAVYTVTGFADEAGLGTITPDGADFTASSLRAALQDANATSADDTIILPAGTYDLTVEGQDNNAAYGDLDIALMMYGGRLTITGADKTTTIIRANYDSKSGFQDRIFEVASGAVVSISNVTIRDGSINANDDNLGAGILVHGTLSSGPQTEVTLDSAIVTENIATTTSLGGISGGGILVYDGNASLTIRNSTISKNQVVSAFTGEALGIYAQGGGIASITPDFTKHYLTILDSTISDNTVRTADLTSDTGGITGDAIGGGIYTEGVTSIVRSTISGNQAISGSVSAWRAFASSGAAVGGGIYSSNDLLLTNSTISSNRITSGDLDDSVSYGGFSGPVLGAGLYWSASQESGGRGQPLINPLAQPFAVMADAVPSGAHVQNSTVVGNTAQAGSWKGDFGTASGGGITDSFGTLDLTSTIIQGNTISGNDNSSGNDLNGSFTTGGNNIIGAADGFGGLTDGVNGDQVGVAEPVVGPLADNGGPTLTHLPILGGRAIDAGSNPSSLTTDQRGASRTLGVATDVGAVELPAASSTVVTSSLNPSVFGDSVTFTATVQGSQPSPIPTGSIIFTIDGVPSAPIALDAGGQASFTTSTLAVGSHSILADYSGDLNYAASSSATLTQVVNVPPPPPNAPPQAGPDSHTVVSGNTLTINAPGILSNDTDADGDTLTAVLGQNVPVNDGTLSLNADGSFTFVPATNFVGTTTFTYFANDGSANSGETTVTITVTPPVLPPPLPPPNRPPVATTEAYTAVAGTPLTVVTPGVLANDTDADGDTLTAVLGQNVPANDGTLSLNADGSFTFVPAANFVGTTTFTYFANDGTDNSGETTVTITVTPPPNQPPQANSNYYSTTPGTPLTVKTPGVLANDSDPEGRPLTAVLGQNVPASEGLLVLNADGSFRFVPAKGFSGGPTHFTYFATDGQTMSAETTVTISVADEYRPYPKSVTTTITSSLNPSVFGEPVTFTATVQISRDVGKSVPEIRMFPISFGSVIFTIDGISSEPVSLDANGHAIFTTNTLVVGSHSVQAYYMQNILFYPSSSDVLTQIVQPVPGGVRRFVVGAGAGGSPRVRVFDEDGVNRGDFFAFEESFLGGVRVATGDLNGDGIDDIVVAAGVGGGPRVSVFDGKSNERLADFFAYEPDFRGGLFVDVGDLNNDGIAEIVTGVGSGGGPRVRAFQLDGKVVQDFYAFDPSSASGVRVAVGNVAGDDDSGDEIVATQGLSGAGQVLILDGTTRAVVQSFSSPDLQNYRGGQFVTVAGRSIVVGVDSVPDFANSVFAKLFPDLTPAEVTRVPEVQIFTPESLAKTGPTVLMNNLPTSVLTPSQSFSAYDDRDLSGVRVAGAKGTDFDFITARGSSENGSVIRLWKIVDGQATLVREFPAFEAGFIGSVYVGG